MSVVKLDNFQKTVIFFNFGQNNDMKKTVLKVVKTIGGGDDGKKPEKKTFKTQAEIDAANLLAKNMALKRGLVSGEDTYVARKIGDPVPEFIDAATGKPIAEPPTKKKTWYVPPHITRNDISVDNGNAWYTDPQTGDIVDIDLNVLNTARFRLPKEKVEQDKAERMTKLIAKAK